MMILSIVLLTLLSPMSLSIPNCISESNNKCSECIERYTPEFSETSCAKCSDNNCLRCLRPNSDSCIKCALGFTLSNSQCGISSCSDMYQCSLCTEDKAECLLCKNGCSISNGTCSCSSRVAIIVVCTVFSAIVLFLVIFCLTKTSTSRKNKVIQFALNANTNQLEMIQNVERPGVILDTDGKGQGQGQGTVNEKGTGIEYREPRQLTILSAEINNTKTNAEDKGMCDYCLIEPAIERLGCGCYLCSRHHAMLKNEKGNNECPICHKEVFQMEVIKCPLCGKGSDEFKALKCSCRLQVCSLCFVDRKCPNCV